METSKTTQELVDKLEKVEVFADGPVGFAGTTSEGETLARQILGRPDADAAFQNLLRSGSTAAQMYALWGLRKLRGRNSTEFFDSYRYSKIQVETMSGCMMMKQTVEEVVKDIENPRYFQLQMKTLWTMNLEHRRKMLTQEEESRFLEIFREYKSVGALDKIAETTFGEMLEREYRKELKKCKKDESTLD